MNLLTILDGDVRSMTLADLDVFIAAASRALAVNSEPVTGASPRDREKIKVMQQLFAKLIEAEQERAARTPVLKG